MLKNPTPGRRRRMCGHLLTTLASLLVGYAAWATEQASTAVPLASRTDSMPSGQEMRGLKLKIRLDPDAKVSIQADHVGNGSNGMLTLEGHVRIDTSMLVARRTPSGRMTAMDRHSAIIEAERALITPQANGGMEVEIENGFRFVRD